MNLYKIQMYLSIVYVGLGINYVIQRDWINVFLIVSLFFFSVFFYFAGKELKKRFQDDEDSDI